MPHRVNPGGSSLRLAAALAGRPCLTADRAASCSANWPASPPAPRRRRHPGTTAGSPTRASGQLITLWWRFVSCPVTRETRPIRGRPRAADQPAYPAAARSSGTRQSLPDSAVPIVAWRTPARPGSVSSWSLDRMTASDFQCRSPRSAELDGRSPNRPRPPRTAATCAASPGKSQLHSVLRCLARSDIPVCPSVDCLWRQVAHRTQSPNCRTWIAGTASPPMAWHLIFLKAVAPVGVDGPNADCMPGSGLVTGARARRHRTSRLAAPTPAAAGAR